MLIVTRKSGETIRIGDDILVTVLATKGGQTRVGITAPRDVAIYCEEVYEHIEKQQEEKRILSIAPYRQRLQRQHE